MIYILQMNTNEFTDTSVLTALKQEKACQVERGREIIDLSMINPDLAPPRLLLDRLIEASMKPYNHRYAVARGIRKLREAFAQKYARRFSVQLDAESQICVTMGTKDALFNVLRCLTKPGASVILGTPTYPVHAAAARLAHLECCYFAIEADPLAMVRNISRLATESGARVVLLNFPNNPTGQVVGAEFYKALSEVAIRLGLFVLNDFVYGEMGLKTQAISMLALSGAANWGAETYSLSKAYNVPGWRVGALLGNARVVSQLAELKSLVDYGVFLPIQIAAAAALQSQEDLVAPTVANYNLRLSLLLRGLTRLGWELNAPQAGCSVWAKLPSAHRALGATGFCQRLLREHAVVALPGEIFGSEFKAWVRFAAVMPEERIQSVLDKL